MEYYYDEEDEGDEDEVQLWFKTIKQHKFTYKDQNGSACKSAYTSNQMSMLTQLDTIHVFGDNLVIEIIRHELFTSLPHTYWTRFKKNKVEPNKTAPIGWQRA